MANNNNSIWSYWLEDFPRALYGAMMPGGTPTFEDYWKGQYGNVYGDYQTALGQLALAGQPPSTTFGQFLDSYPFASKYNLLSPSQLGYRTPSRMRWRV